MDLALLQSKSLHKSAELKLGHSLDEMLLKVSLTVHSFVFACLQLSQPSIAYVPFPPGAYCHELQPEPVN